MAWPRSPERRPSRRSSARNRTWPAMAWGRMAASPGAARRLFAALARQAAADGFGSVLRAEGGGDRARGSALLGGDREDRLRGDGEDDVEDHVALGPRGEVGDHQRTQVLVVLRPARLSLEDGDLQRLLVVLAG